MFQNKLLRATMKKVLIFLALTLFIVSCKKNDTAPVLAGFTYKELENGEIQFFNESSEAESYVWNFGDGSTSQEAFPTHIYAANGEYEVTLVAKGPNGENTKAQKVKVTSVKNYEGTWEGAGQFTIVSGGVPAENRSYVVDITKLSETTFKATVKEYKNGSQSDLFDFKNCTLTLGTKKLSIFEEVLTFDKKAYRRCEGTMDIVNNKLVISFSTKTQWVEIKYDMTIEKKI